MPTSSNKAHGLGAPSGWVQRWAHLIREQGTVLDLACGHGRHMQWLQARGHRATGVDRSADAITAASHFGEAVLADIENAPWPLMNDSQVRMFDAVVVTNYLWRPLFQVIQQSLADGGVLIYETFAQGNETVGKPSRPDFLLQPGELLQVYEGLHIVAFENGFLDQPERFVQRIAAIKLAAPRQSGPEPVRYRL